MSLSSIYFNLKPMFKFAGHLSASQLGKHRGPMKACYKKWGVRYLAETKRNYYINSRGGGDWPPLAASTLKQRRGEGKRAAIMIDTGTIVGALDAGAKGSLFKYIRMGVRVGFGGPERHPEGKATIRDIAVFHDEGQGRLPKRQILRQPSRKLLVAMKMDLRVAIKTIGRRI